MVFNFAIFAFGFVLLFGAKHTASQGTSCNDSQPIVQQPTDLGG